MNLFGDVLTRGVIGLMNNNNWNAGSAKEVTLRKQLQTCTYPDETKYTIEKAIKQVLHVYPFFSTDLIMFTELGVERRYIQIKGILELQIKGRICKIDFNMMLPFDFPRSPPFVRIINRNLDYKVDSFYQELKSHTDQSSYILNTKLNTIQTWHPSNSLVNVILQANDLFKSRFPFSKPSTQTSIYGQNKPNNNAWDTMYNNKMNNNNNNNYGFINTGSNWNQPSQPVNNAWSNNNVAWGNNNNNNAWGSNNVGWNQNANTGSNWGNNNWSGSGNNILNTIGSCQKLVASQKDRLKLLNQNYVRILDKNQQLDIIKKSLQSEQNYLRKQNYEMSNFLSSNEKASLPDRANLVQTKDPQSEQILDLLSGLKARQDCIQILQGKFNQEQISLEEFMKNLRRLEENRFEQKFILKKCLNRGY